MIQGEDKASKIDIGIAWYKRGRCPCCGKSPGEPRGLEYRVRSWDLYCHTYLTALRDELSFLESDQADLPSIPAPDLPIHQGDSGQRQNGLRRLGRLLQRIEVG